MNAAAQALLEEGLANGVAPPVKKKMKSKQTTKPKTLKSKLMEQWHPSAEAKPNTKRVSKAKAKPKPVSKAKAKSKTKAKSEDAVWKIWKHCQGAKVQK